jgi:hypothetical protein
MGDEFSGGLGNMARVMSRGERFNRVREGEPRVRIHAVGFPVVIMQTISFGNTGLMFSILMREICHRNGGTFIGLPQ